MKITSRAKLYGLVRDASGRPKIDGDPRLLPDEIKEKMTAQEYFEAIERWNDGNA